MSKLTRRKATHSSRNFCLARATLLNTCCAESQRLYYWWDSHILVYLVNERFSTNRWGRETVLFLKIRDCSVRTFKFKCCSLVLARSGRTWEWLQKCKQKLQDLQDAIHSTRKRILKRKVKIPSEWMWRPDHNAGLVGTKMIQLCVELSDVLAVNTRISS